jgi:hypothetical protein
MGSLCLNMISCEKRGSAYRVFHALGKSVTAIFSGLQPAEDEPPNAETSRWRMDPACVQDAHSQMARHNRLRRFDRQMAGRALRRSARHRVYLP